MAGWILHPNWDYSGNGGIGSGTFSQTNAVVTSECGSDGGNDAEGALNCLRVDGNVWRHQLTLTINHTPNSYHYFILDLGQLYDISKVIGFSRRSTYDPTDVAIFTNDTHTGSFAPAWSSSGWQALTYDINDWQSSVYYTEYNDIVDNNWDNTKQVTRYVMVRVYETESITPINEINWISWGHGALTKPIFDVYGEPIASSSSSSSSFSSSSLSFSSSSFSSSSHSFSSSSASFSSSSSSSSSLSFSSSSSSSYSSSSSSMSIAPITGSENNFETAELGNGSSEWTFASNGYICDYVYPISSLPSIVKSDTTSGFLDVFGTSVLKIARLTPSIMNTRVKFIPLDYEGTSEYTRVYICVAEMVSNTNYYTNIIKVIDDSDGTTSWGLRVFKTATGTTLAFIYYDEQGVYNSTTLILDFHKFENVWLRYDISGGSANADGVKVYVRRPDGTTALDDDDEYYHDAGGYRKDSSEWSIGLSSVSSVQATVYYSLFKVSTNHWPLLRPTDIPTISSSVFYPAEESGSNEFNWGQDLYTGNTDSSANYGLIDSGTDFANVLPGDQVYNTTEPNYNIVALVDSTNQAASGILGLDTHIFDTLDPQNYYIFSNRRTLAEQEQWEVLYDGTDTTYLAQKAPTASKVQLFEHSISYSGYGIGSIRSIRIHWRGARWGETVAEDWRSMGQVIQVYDPQAESYYDERRLYEFALEEDFAEGYVELTRNPETGERWTWPELEKLRCGFRARVEDPSQGWKAGGKISETSVEVLHGGHDTEIIVCGPVFGAVTTSQIQVFLRTSGPCTAKVRWGTSSTLATYDEQTHEVDSDGGFTHIFTITGLDTDQKYYFSLLAGDDEQYTPGVDPLPYCSTFPAENSDTDFDFIFTGDMTSLAPSKTFESIGAYVDANPLTKFMLLVGDLTSMWRMEQDGYDGVNPGSKDEIRDRYQAHLSGINEVFRTNISNKLPIFSTWSDHDAHSNGAEKFSTPRKRICREIFHEWRPSPPFGGGLGSGDGFYEDDLQGTLTHADATNYEYFITDSTKNFETEGIFPGMMIGHFTDPDDNSTEGTSWGVVQTVDGDTLKISRLARYAIFRGDYGDTGERNHHIYDGSTGSKLVGYLYDSTQDFESVPEVIVGDVVYNCHTGATSYVTSVASAGSGILELQHDIFTEAEAGETYDIFTAALNQFTNGDTYVIYRTGVWYKFKCANVELFVSDMRYRRDRRATTGGDIFDGRKWGAGSGADSGDGTGEGHLQRDWLKANANASTARFKLWLTEIPFNSTAIGPEDRWGDYDPTDAQRNWVINNISAQNFGILCGDRHYAGIDDGTYSNWPEMDASPMCDKPHEADQVYIGTTNAIEPFYLKHTTADFSLCDSTNGEWVVYNVTEDHRDGARVLGIDYAAGGKLRLDKDIFTEATQNYQVVDGDNAIWTEGIHGWSPTTMDYRHEAFHFGVAKIRGETVTYEIYNREGTKLFDKDVVFYSSSSSSSSSSFSSSSSSSSSFSSSSSSSSSFSSSSSSHSSSSSSSSSNSFSSSSSSSSSFSSSSSSSSHSFSSSSSSFSSSSSSSSSFSSSSSSSSSFSSSSSSSSSFSSSSSSSSSFSSSSSSSSSFSSSSSSSSSHSFSSSSSSSSFSSSSSSSSSFSSSSSSSSFSSSSSSSSFSSSSSSSSSFSFSSSSSSFSSSSSSSSSFSFSSSSSSSGSWSSHSISSSSSSFSSSSSSSFSSSSSSSSFSSSSSSSGSLVPWYYPINVDTTIGGVANKLSDTYTDNGVKYTIIEIANNPGFASEFTFEDVPQTFVTMNLNGFYDGIGSHIVILRQWNYNLAQWDDVTLAQTDFSDNNTDQNYSINLIDDINYLNNGELKIQIIHNNPGSTGDYFYIDHLYLTERASSSSSSSSSFSSSSSSSSSFSSSSSSSSSHSSSSSSSSWSSGSFSSSSSSHSSSSHSSSSHSSSSFSSSSSSTLYRNVHLYSGRIPRLELFSGRVEVIELDSEMITTIRLYSGREVE